jgi:hypothetical protein
MFSFFKKQSNQKYINQNLDGFQDGFSEGQKESVTVFLFKTAKCNGATTKKEEEFIQSTSKLLGFELNASSLATALQKGIAFMIDNLKELSDVQKIWLVVSVRELLQINGEIDDIKFKYSSTVFGHIGITDEILSKIDTIKF